MATDFEGHTHEQLLAMIASIDPGTVTVRAAQLSNAAKAIEEIGESLKRHRVRGWDGEAADAFQDWVSRAGNATLRLAEYGAEAGRWLTEAAQTMIEVKANTPPYDTAAAANLRSAHEHHNDPDAREAARTAHSTLDADHERAIQQLTKLAQSYEASATQLTRAQLPTFPPPPGAFVPDGYSGSVDLARSGGGTGREIGEGYGSDPVPLMTHGVPQNWLGHPSGSLGTRDGFLPGSMETGRASAGSAHDVGVHLDHVATASDRTMLPPTNTPGGVGIGSAAGGMGVVPVPAPLPTLPPTTGVHGSRGSTPFAIKPPAVGDGISRVGGSGPLPARDAGVIGGRPVSANTPSAGIPRGTVIGTENAHPVGRGMGGGFGLPPGSPGAEAGRRLPMDPGTAVGERQPSGSRPFTEGGSGLVRNGMGPGAVGGAMGHAGMSTPPQGRRRSDQVGIRSDYLTEDEETWQSNRRIVPPVID
ncbi:WXG100 family type VII secretion target [Streptomyces sp. NPDC054904]